MKKSAIAICGAVLAAVAFAQEPAPAPECGNPSAPAEKPAFQRPDRPQRAKPGRQGQRPPALVIDEKTTPEQVEAYKKLVAEKIDAAFASFKDKPVAEGEAKAPTRVLEGDLRWARATDPRAIARRVRAGTAVPNPKAAAPRHLHPRLPLRKLNNEPRPQAIPAVGWDSRVASCMRGNPPCTA